MEHKEGFLKETLKKGVERISDSAVDFIKKKADDIADGVQERIVRIEMLLLNKLIGSLVILVGMIFLSLSIVYFLVNYAKINISFAFLIVALMLVIVGLFLRMMKGGDKDGKR